MGDTTVRISGSAGEILREMAHVEGRPMQALLEEAIETLRRSETPDLLTKPPRKKRRPRAQNQIPSSA